jgi:hypothetical protein
MKVRAIPLFAAAPPSLCPQYLGAFGASIGEAAERAQGFPTASVMATIRKWLGLGRKSLAAPGSRGEARRNAAS